MRHKNMVIILEYLRIYFTLFLYLSCKDSARQSFVPQDGHLKRKQTILNSR